MSTGVDSGIQPRISISQDSPCTERETVHLLPCHIKYSGPAPVAEFFQSSTTQTNETRPKAPEESNPEPVVCEAYFRGRKLVGTQISLPENYVGTVFDSSAQSNTRPVRTSHDFQRTPGADSSGYGDQSYAVDEEDLVMEELTRWTVKSKFDKIVVYNNSECMGSADGVTRGLTEWITLANVLHGA